MLITPAVVTRICRLCLLHPCRSSRVMRLVALWTRLTEVNCHSGTTGLKLIRKKPGRVVHLSDVGWTRAFWLRRIFPSFVVNNDYLNHERLQFLTVCDCGHKRVKNLHPMVVLGMMCALAVPITAGGQVDSLP